MQFIKQKIQSVIVSCGLALLLVSPVSALADSMGYDYDYGNSYDYNYGNSYSTSDYSYDYGNSYNYDYGNTYSTPSYNYDYGNSYDYNYGNSYSTSDYSYDYGNSYNYDYGNTYSAPTYDYSYGNSYNYDYGNIYSAPDYSYDYGNSYNYDYGNTYSTPSYNYDYGNSYDYNYGNTYSAPSYDFNYANSYDSYDYNYGNSYTYDYNYGNDYAYDYDYGNTYDFSAFQAPQYEAPAYSAPNFSAPSYSTSNYDVIDTFVDYYTPQYQAPSYSTPQYQAPVYASNQGYGLSYLQDFGSGCYRSNCVDREINNPPREEENFSVSCFATDSRVKIGETASFRAEVSGGNGSKTYSWSGIASGSGQAVTSSKLTSAGTKSATVTVKSGNLTRTANCSVTVEDYEPLEVSCVANPTRAEVDDSVSFVATARGGNGSYTYSWSGAVTGNSKVEAETFDSKGTKTGVVTVKSGTKTETASCSVTIIEDESDLNATCSVSPENPIEDKDTVTWRASATGGNGNYTYEWHGDITGSGSIVRKEYSTDGTKTATVKITSDGKTIERTCSVYVKSEDDDEDDNDDVRATCEVSPSVVRVGETVSFRGEGDGGDGDFEYRWSGDISSSSRIVERSFSTTGTKEVTLRVTSDGKSDTDDCTVNVRVVGGSSVTLLSNGGDTGTLSSGVFLSEIPYTGASSGTKIALFILGLALWSAVIAHILIKKRARKHGVSYKQAQSDIVADFKRQNMLKKGITA